MRRGEIDILIGTQMVAKGHDFSRLTLVGVVAADVGLHLPDFRAAERTFQLLTQVAGPGRAGGPAGRGHRPDLPARALRGPVCRGARLPFFLRARGGRARGGGLPPLPAAGPAPLREQGGRSRGRGREVGARIPGETGARRAVFGGKAAGAIEFLGPAAAPLRRVRGMYRHHMLLKAASAARLNAEVEAALAAFAAEPALRAVRLIADIDPLSLL